MFKSIEIQNFRCFKELEVQNLRRVNLIAGQNNAGKTALLEAIFLHLGAHNPELALRLNVFRAIETVAGDVLETFGWLFNEKEVQRIIKIATLDECGDRSSLGIQFAVPESSQQPSPDSKSIPGSATTGSGQTELRFEFRDSTGKYFESSLKPYQGRLEIKAPRTMAFPLSIFVSTGRGNVKEVAERFSKLEEVGRENEVVEVLQIMEPNLKRLAVHTAGGVLGIRADIGMSRLVPVAILGEGIVRLLSMVLSILSAKDGVVLIDELENGLHHSIMESVWRSLGDAAARSNVQLFATTHSRECAIAAHRAFSEKLVYDFALHRLERTAKGTRVISYDQEVLETSADMNLELR